MRTLKHPLITVSVAENFSSLPGVSGYYSEMGTRILYTGLNVVPGNFTEELKRLEESGESANPEEAEIMALFREAAKEYNKCVIIVSHSNEVAKQADVVFVLKHGKLGFMELC